MSEIDVRKIVGDSFEDLTIAEMTQVQGSGDVQVRTTPICAFSASVLVSYGVVKTLKGHC
ncbi:MAG: lichenicidin A2 family type 2 lantibiotic [Streptococcaceae bacterium]|nr:lichenicidin A2 family type 2 lantibiotic [Streptococcaceae bacterium]